MSYSALHNIPYNGGFLELSRSNTHIFQDVRSNDIVLYTDCNDQSIVMGTLQGAQSAFKISSNVVHLGYNLYAMGYIASGTSNFLRHSPVHRLTIMGPSNSVDGPNAAYFIREDSNYPLFQQYNANHDEIYLTLDAYYTGSNWNSSHCNSFQIAKTDGHMIFASSCNGYLGSNIDSNWFPAIAINSNSFVGFGTSNPNHRMHVWGQDSSVLGPHVALYTSIDSNPLFQLRAWTHDDTTLSFDAYHDSNVWRSTDSNGNFQIKKNNGRLLFMSACNTAPGDSLDSNWYVAMMVNSNAFVGIGTSNPTNKVTISGIDSSELGPHTDIYTTADPSNPVYQQLVWNNNDISTTFGAYYRSNEWISSSANGNFKQRFNDGRLMVQTSCNNPVGSSNLQWYTAFSVNSNSYIGIGTSNPTQKLSVVSKRSDILGPHVAFSFEDNPNNITFQQQVWDNDHIELNFDMHNSNGAYVSSTLSNNVQLIKNNKQFMIRTACNIEEGSNIDMLYPVFVADPATGFVALGTSNATHKLTIASSNPGMAFSLQDDSNIIYEHLNTNHDQITQAYDAYWNGSQWVSTHSNANFMVQKHGGRYMIQSSCNNDLGSTIEWDNVLTINSNGYIGIGTSNPTQKLSISSKRSNPEGPHVAFTFDDNPNNITFQQQVWDNDHIELNFDMHNSNGAYVSSTSSNNYQLAKKDGFFMVNTACNVSEGSEIQELYPMLVMDAETGYVGFGTSNATHKITVVSQEPNVAYSIGEGCNLVVQQINQHDGIYQSFDAYLQNTDWISSSSNANFQIAKSNSLFMIRSASNVGESATISAWHPSITLTSNGFVGIANENPLACLDVAGSVNIRSNLDVSQAATFESNLLVYGEASLSNNVNIYGTLYAYSNIVMYQNLIVGGSQSISDLVVENSAQINNMLDVHGVLTAHSNLTLSNNGSVSMHTSNNMLGIDTQNPTEKLTVSGPSNSSLGPHVSYKFIGDPNAVFQQRNYSHDDVSLSFDAYYGSSSWISSSVSGNVVAHKKNSKLMVLTACNAAPGSSIDGSLFPALSVDMYTANIGIGTSNASHRLTLAGGSNNILGPHVAAYLDGSEHPVYQQLNWSNDFVATNYDCYYDGSDWRSSSTSGSISLRKTAGQFVVYTACNTSPGLVLSEMFPALTISSNSFVGIGMRAPKHRLSLMGPSNNFEGPNVACYITEDTSNPVFQQYHFDQDNIAMSFGSYWDGYNWVSSTSNGNFQIKTKDGQMMLMSSTFGYVGSNINTSFSAALTVNSNSYVGIANSNPTAPLDVTGISVFRSNINVMGDVLPMSNKVYDLGSSTKRFRDLYLSGSSIDMEGLDLRKDFTGGLMVYNNNMTEMARVWVKEIMIGDPANPMNSNVFLLTASSNGMQFNNVTSNLPPQPYSQFNNMYVLSTSVGIGIDAPEKTFQVQGDVEINPIYSTSLYWNNTVLRLDLSDINAPAATSVTSWSGTVSRGENAPTYFASGGYYNLPTVRFSYPNSYMTTQANIFINASDNSGFTAMAMVRFNNAVPDESIFSFSNNGFFVRLGRSNVTNIMVFETAEMAGVPLESPAGTILENEWALYAITYDATDLKMYKNQSEIASIAMSTMANMEFLPQTNMRIGFGNMDIMALYVFDTALSDAQLSELSKNVSYPGHQSFKINVTSSLFPPDEFFYDVNGFTKEGTRNGGQVYSKALSGMYYGNGTYRIWASSEFLPAQNIIDWDPLTGWLTQTQSYNQTADAPNAPTVYAEMPVNVSVVAYTITASTDYPDTSPSKWKLYSSTNGVCWSLIDQRSGELSWTTGESRTYYSNTLSAGKFFKLEMFRNSSFPDDYIGLNDFRIYGNECQFQTDGSGVAINTCVATERLTVDGGAAITENMRVGKQGTELHANVFALPPKGIYGPVSVLKGTYYIDQSTGEGYLAFVNNGSSFWTSGASYDPDGNYVANTHSITVSGTGYEGEWVSIQMPEQCVVKSYKVTPTSLESAPHTFVLAGSHDGVVWNLVDNRTHAWSSVSPQTFYASSNSIAYTRYVFITRKIGSGGVSAQIAGIVLYGEQLLAGGADNSRLTVHGEIHAKSMFLTPLSTNRMWSLTTNSLGEGLHDGAMLGTWDVCSQGSADNMPTYMLTGGINNSSYARFDGSVLVGGSGTLKAYTQGGFAAVVSVRFRSTTNNEQLFSFDSSVYARRNGVFSSLSFVVGANSVLTPTGTIVDNEWAVFAFKFDNATRKMQVFKNGSLVASAYRDALTNDIAYSSSKVGMGAKADIAAVLVWDSSLDDAELVQEVDYLLGGSPALYIPGHVKHEPNTKTNTYNSTLLRYPPASLASDMWILKNQQYGNGAYHVTSSGFYQNNDEYAPYKAFDNNASETWLGFYNSYDSSGHYLGTNGLNGYLGEWIQIELPETVIADAVWIYPDATAISSWKLFGSLNGYEWDLLDTVISHTWGSYVEQLFPFSNTKEHKVFRLVVSNTQPGAQTISLRRMSIRAVSKNVMSIVDNKVAVFGSLSVGCSNTLGAVTVGGSIVPCSNAEYDLGTSDYRFRDLYLSGNSINMNDLQLSREPLSGGLLVSSYLDNSLGRLYVKEILLGDPSNPSNSNIVMLVPSSNGLQVQQNANRNQEYNQTNNAYFTETSVGIGLSNPSALLEIHGDCNVLRLSGSTDSTPVYMEFAEPLGKNAAVGLDGTGGFFIDGSNNSIDLMTGGASRLTVGSSGGIVANTDVIVNGTLTVNNFVYMQSNIYIYNSEIIQSNLTVQNDTTLCNTSNHGSISVSGVSVLSNNVYVYGNTSNFGSLVVASNLNVRNVQVHGDLSNSGSASFMGGLAVYSGITLASNNSISFSNQAQVQRIYQAAEGLEIGRPGMNDVFVNNNGNLGVRKSNALYPLDVVGDINFSGMLRSNGVPYVSSQWSNSDNNLYIIGSNVGIGKSNPITELDVLGSANVSGIVASSGLQIFKDTGAHLPGMNTRSIPGLNIETTGFFNDDFGMTFNVTSNTSSNSFRFYGSNTEVLRISGDGKIGIGTNTPLATLHVNGTTLFTGQAIVLSNQTNPFMIIQNNGAGTALMGVSTTPGVFSTHTGVGDFVIKSFTGAKVLLQSGNAASAVCINTANNVGIGNPVPQHPLDVCGNINTSGYYLMSCRPTLQMWDTNPATAGDRYVPSFSVQSNLGDFGVGGTNNTTVTVPVKGVYQVQYIAYTWNSNVGQLGNSTTPYSVVFEMSVPSGYTLDDEYDLHQTSYSHTSRCQSGSSFMHCVPFTGVFNAGDSITIKTATCIDGSLQWNNQSLPSAGGSNNPYGRFMMSLMEAL